MTLAGEWCTFCEFTSQIKFLYCVKGRDDMMHKCWTLRQAWGAQPKNKPQPKAKAEGKAQPKGKGKAQVQGKSSPCLKRSATKDLGQTMQDMAHSR